MLPIQHLSIEFTLMELQLQFLGKDLSCFAEQIDECRKKICAAVMTYAPHLYVTSNDLKTRMSFLVSSKRFELWDVTGGISFGHFDSTTISTELLEWLHHSLLDYSSGIYQCSDCGCLMHQEDIAGSYFAGIYCPTCWETKGWREREAKETYN